MYLTQVAKINTLAIIVVCVYSLVVQSFHFKAPILSSNNKKIQRSFHTSHYKLDYSSVRTKSNLNMASMVAKTFRFAKNCCYVQ